VEKLIRLSRVHNINFVTPDHFFPHVFCLVSRLREEDFDIPVVFNLSGYESSEAIKVAQDYADIYLPDFKYADASLAGVLSKCRDYPKVALHAISEMVAQKGFLDACETGGAAVAKKGVLVRHLILPGNVENSLNALTILFLEFGKGLPLSLMSQYHPTRRQKNMNLNRFVSRDEFDRVYSHAMELGFENLFVQFPTMEPNSKPAHSPSPYLPDFQQAEPFQ
jgi:putative pyruvate formate lyase activating enzyme